VITARNCNDNTQFNNYGHNCDCDSSVLLILYLIMLRSRLGKGHSGHCTDCLTWTDGWAADAIVKGRAADAIVKGGAADAIVKGGAADAIVKGGYGYTSTIRETC
jgi:hypothetical protein